MVAALLSAGANPSLVTDPTAVAPGGYTPADLAAKQGYVGLAAYLAEKGLTAHFESMSLSQNTDRSPSRAKLTKVQSEKFENLTEQELCLKESLAAYRNAADAASNIQAVLRDRTLKLQTKAIQLAHPEIQAAAIVAAMRIQHAFRNYNKKKEMRAAARIQNHFRTWKVRRNFTNMRRQAIRIQVSCMFLLHDLICYFLWVNYCINILHTAEKHLLLEFWVFNVSEEQGDVIWKFLFLGSKSEVFPVLLEYCNNYNTSPGCIPRPPSETSVPQGNMVCWSRGESYFAMEKEAKRLARHWKWNASRNDSGCRTCKHG